MKSVNKKAALERAIDKVGQDPAGCCRALELAELADTFRLLMPDVRSVAFALDDGDVDKALSCFARLETRITPLRARLMLAAGVKSAGEH